MKQLVPAIITLFSFFNLNAQSDKFSWVISSGSTGYDHGGSIASDHMGNILVAGSFQGTVDFDPGSGVYNLTSTTLSDQFVQKLDTNGNFLWARSWHETASMQECFVTTDASGNVYLTGPYDNAFDADPGSGIFTLTTHGGPNDIFIIKLRNNGDFVWAKSIGSNYDEECEFMTSDSKGNIYLTGMFKANTMDFDPGPGTYNLYSYGAFATEDAFVLKLDSNGNFIWARSMGGPNRESGKSVSIDMSGNVYTTGYYESFADFDPSIATYNLTSNGARDIFVHKMDSSGNFLWVKSIGGTSTDEGWSMLTDASGNTYSTGVFSNIADFDPGPATYNLNTFGGHHTYVLKLDPNGNMVWAKAVPGHLGESIASDDLNNIYVTGNFSGTGDFDPGPGNFTLSMVGFRDVFILKLETGGNFVWAKSVGSVSDDYGRSITTDAHNNIYVTGQYRSSVDFDPGVSTYFQSSKGNSDIFVLKLGPCTASHGIDSVQACDSVTWLDGNTYTSANHTAVYTIDGGNVYGCDSIVTLNLEITNSGVHHDTVTACGSYLWIDGITYTSSNHAATYYVPGGSANGCDSIMMMNLTILPHAQHTDVRTACDSLQWIDGNTYTSTNNTATHTLTGAAANGCDSIITLDFTTLSNSGTDYITECDAHTWIDGITYTSNNNTAQFTLTNSAGCDSLVSLDLTILNSTAAIDTIVTCDSTTWMDGITYYANNHSAVDTLSNVHGCDSIVFLDLTVHHSIASTDSVVTCDSLTWIDGNTYHMDNHSATHLMHSIYGCDSLITLNLTLNHAKQATDTIHACDSYTWIDGNTYYHDNSTAKDTLQSMMGCDSVVTLDLKLTNVITGVTFWDQMLIAHATGVSYQWLDCNENLMPIPEATQSSFAPTINGWYALEVTENGCVDTSECITVVTIGITESEDPGQVIIYPNPTNGHIYVNTGENSDVSLKVYNDKGQMVYSKELFGDPVYHFQIEGPSGIYFIELNMPGKIKRYKVAKH